MEKSSDSAFSRYFLIFSIKNIILKFFHFKNIVKTQLVLVTIEVVM